MGVVRSMMLAMSQSEWLRVRAPRYGFVRRTAGRFMPGEHLDDAIAAARALEQQKIGSVFSALGENVTDPAEAERESHYYVDVLSQLRAAGLPLEVSVKLTHLGLDLDPEFCFANLKRIVDAAPRGRVWIDMEQSTYVDRTIALFNRVHTNSPQVGICLQSYLYRTAKDIGPLIERGAAIRLVKGAYMESKDVAFAKKLDVDRNFARLAAQLLTPEARTRGVRAAIATHDVNLIYPIAAQARQVGLSKQDFEFQMLYGIQRDEQVRLARDGYRMIVHICYGTYWFPWFMRRMAERPANAWFAVKNIVAG